MEFIDDGFVVDGNGMATGANYCKVPKIWLEAGQYFLQCNVESNCEGDGYYTIIGASCTQYNVVGTVNRHFTVSTSGEYEVRLGKHLTKTGTCTFTNIQIVSTKFEDKTYELYVEPQLIEYEGVELAEGDTLDVESGVLKKYIDGEWVVSQLTPHKLKSYEGTTIITTYNNVKADIDAKVPVEGGYFIDDLLTRVKALEAKQAQVPSILPAPEINQEEEEITNE